MQNGAVDWDRTSDLLVTNELLYQLSYNGTPPLYHTCRPHAIIITLSPSLAIANQLLESAAGGLVMLLVWPGVMLTE